MPLRRVLPFSAACLLACAPSATQPSPPAPDTESPSAVARQAPADAGRPDAPRVTPGKGDFGREGPVAFLAASATGEWVGLCQPPLSASGRPLEQAEWLRSVELGQGRALSVKSIAATDPRGRYLVVERGERFELVDARTGSITRLSEEADGRRVLANYVGHRSFAFDSAGERLAYLTRSRTSGSRIVIRDLAAGTQITGPKLDSEALRLRFIPGPPESLMLDGVLADTNGDGKRTLPKTFIAAPRDCRKRGGFVATGKASGDALVAHVVNTTTARAKPAPGRLMVLGQDRIFRDDKGRLLLYRGLQRFVLADADCGARVLAGNVSRRLLLVACYKVPGRSPLRLVGPNLSTELEVDLAFAGEDHVSQLDTQLFGIHPGKNAALVDFEQARLINLGEKRLVVSVRKRFALVREKSKLLGISVPRDAAKPPRQSVILDDLASVTELVLGQRHLVIGGWVLERAGGRVLGKVAGHPLSVDATGRVLTARPSEANSAVTGPLRYVRPALKGAAIGAPAHGLGG